jgi:hypothetical protein
MALFYECMQRCARKRATLPTLLEMADVTAIDRFRRPVSGELEGCEHEPQLAQDPTIHSYFSRKPQPEECDIPILRASRIGARCFAAHPNSHPRVAW